MIRSKKHNIRYISLYGKTFYESRLSNRIISDQKMITIWPTYEPQSKPIHDKQIKIRLPWVYPNMFLPTMQSLHTFPYHSNQFHTKPWYYSSLRLVRSASYEQVVDFALWVLKAKIWFTNILHQKTIPTIKPKYGHINSYRRSKT